MITSYLNNEPTLLLILFLGAVGYWIASGAAHANYRALHVVLGVALFFIIGFGTYYIIGRSFDVHVAWKIVAAFASIAVIAYCWRRWWAEPVFVFLRNWSVTTTSFGPSKTWDIIESVPGRRFHYYRVELTDGTQMGSDTASLVNMDIDFPPEIIVDEEGNVALVVTEIWKDGEDESISHNPIDEYGRTEYTYIPAANVKMIELYFKQDKKKKCKS